MIANGTMPQGPVLVGGAEVNSSFDRAIRAGRKSDLVRYGWGDSENRSQIRPPTVVNEHPKPEDKILEKEIIVSEFYHIAGKSVGGVALGIYIHCLKIAYAHQLGRTARSTCLIYVVYLLGSVP